MFLDPTAPSAAATTLTEVLGWLREVSIIGVIIGFAWKARGAWDSATDFLDDVKTHLAVSKVHMAKMEKFAEEVSNNHLHHIETALNTMANIEPDKNE
jgi:hypothetical protein